ncbi:MAG: hypothetical protein JW781_03285 [Deltaproteobacteria bacterium]|nr:hypothetical protein [Candidatus Anaeroferrophillacea bacterium]
MSRGFRLAMILVAACVCCLRPAPAVTAPTAAPSANSANPFLPLLTPASPAAPAAAGTDRESVPADEIRLPSHVRLDGIIASGMRHSAIVGGRVVRPGDVVEGFEVTDIGADRVVFRRDGRRIELVLAPAVDRVPTFTILPAAGSDATGRETDGAAQ